MFNRIPRRPTPIGLGVLILAITACGGASLAPNATPTPTLTPTPVPQATLSAVTQSKSGVDASAFDITVTATCPVGKLMVGGGYHLQLANNQQFIYIRADYPSAANAWTVTETNAQSGGAVTLTAYAFCLTTNFAVTASLATATSSASTASVACPVGTTLVGGGFNESTLIGSGWVTASYPAAGAWQVTRPSSGPPNTYIVYAVCASKALTPSAINTATATIANNTSGEADASCGARETLIGGGFSATKGALYIGEDDRASNTFAQWMVAALNLYEQPVVGGGGGPPPPPPAMQVIAYGICVKPA